MQEKSIRKPLVKVLAIIMAAMLLLCCTEIGIWAQTNDLVAPKAKSGQTMEDKEHEAKEKDLRVRLGPPIASPFSPREVGDNELVEKRSELEDRLRRELLACSEKGAYKELINSALTEQTVEQFGKLAIHEDNGVLRPMGGEYKWASIMNLLAFVATTCRDQPVGQKATEVFDRALTAAKKGGYKYWFYCMYAIKMYGSSDLLTPTFWKAKEQGLDCHEAFYGDRSEKEVLNIKEHSGADDLKEIGYQIKKSNIHVPAYRYQAERKNSAGTNSVVEGK